MSNDVGRQTATWNSRLGFILAATGSAVGLGNIWKFPYIAGENGGGAFVLVYLVCIALIGLPVMMAEVLVGRRSRQSPITAYETLSNQAGVGVIWHKIGWLGVLAGFLVLSFYVVIAGWALAYVFEVARGVFVDASAEQVGQHFGQFIANPWIVGFWGTLLLWTALGVQSLGVNHGIERAVEVLMPGMLILLLILVGYAYVEGDFARGVSFLFEPDFSKLTADGVLIALGHAFFTLSLASGVMVIFGAYLPAGVSIGGTSIIVAIADTLIALIAGMAIFPIVFAHGLEPSSGPGLIFTTLPIAFGEMAFGTLIGTLFFTMLVFAAFTSAISLVEAFVAWIIERFGSSRRKAIVTVGMAVWLLSFGTVFSFNIWSDPIIFGKNFFDALDYLTANVMLPLGGLLVTLFVGWRIKPAVTTEELAMPEHSVRFQLWLWIVRIVAPLAILLVFLRAIEAI